MTPVIFGLLGAAAYLLIVRESRNPRAAVAAFASSPDLVAVSDEAGKTVDVESGSGQSLVAVTVESLSVLYVLSAGLENTISLPAQVEGVLEDGVFYTTDTQILIEDILRYTASRAAGPWGDRAYEVYDMQRFLDVENAVEYMNLLIEGICGNPARREPVRLIVEDWSAAGGDSIGSLGCGGGCCSEVSS
jgi:hypothetical protein